MGNCYQGASTDQQPAGGESEKATAEWEREASKKQGIKAEVPIDDSRIVRLIISWWPRQTASQ
jgi:hypothetical protein